MKKCVKIYLSIFKMLKIGYLSFCLFFFMGLLYFLYKYNLTSKTIGEKLERNE